MIQKPADKSTRHEVKVIAAVPERLRAHVYARLKLVNTTFKDWLREQMEMYADITPLQDRRDKERHAPLQVPDPRPQPVGDPLPLHEHGLLSRFRLCEVLHGVIAPQDAVTIAQLVRVSTSVCDAVMVYATPGAAQLFGYTHPSLLVGRYMSTLHHPTDALITRHYTLARLHRDWCPDPHPIRILRHPSLEPVPVLQHVFQARMGDLLTWITGYTPFDYASRFVMPVTSAMLTRAGSSVEEQLLGRMHIVHMEQQLHPSHPTILPSLFHLVHTSADYMLEDTEKNLFARAKDPTKRLVHRIAQTLGHLVASQNERPHYVCLKCRWPWYGTPGGPARPRKCPRCNDKYWDQFPRAFRAESLDT